MYVSTYKSPLTPKSDAFSEAMNLDNGANPHVLRSHHHGSHEHAWLELGPQQKNIFFAWFMENKKSKKGELVLGNGPQRHTDGEQLATRGAKGSPALAPAAGRSLSSQAESRRAGPALSGGSGWLGGVGWWGGGWLVGWGGQRNSWRDATLCQEKKLPLFLQPVVGVKWMGKSSNWLSRCESKVPKPPA